MLVSSIGYFNPLSNMVHRTYVVNNQSTKVNLNEGFGNINEVQPKENTNWLKSFVNNCQLFFAPQKADESKKYLNLIA